MNKQERTYTVLRDRIHSGAFGPQARLNIDALARELGVSAIPVREALRRLEAEGWVKFQPNVGAIVAPLDATAWEQQMVAVAILEGAATAEAAPHLRPGDFAKVRKLAAEMEQIAAEGDMTKFSRLNRRLHAVIVARCPNAYLLELLEQTNQRLDRIRDTMFTYLPERSKRAVAEHEHLIRLLEVGDPAEIERYARWHKLQTVEAYRAAHEEVAGREASLRRRANSIRRPVIVVGLIRIHSRSSVVAPQASRPGPSSRAHAASDSFSTSPRTTTDHPVRLSAS